MPKVTVVQGHENLQVNSGLIPVDNLISNLGLCSSSFLNNEFRTARWISNGQVVKSAILLQCLGKTDFEDIAKLNDNDMFTICTGRKISPETFRQRFNKISQDTNFYTQLDHDNARILKNAHFKKIEIQGKEYIPLDIDVTPFSNPGVNKEGISCTYKLEDGFAPIIAYIGSYALCSDLRIGSQHSECEAVPFLNRCMAIIKEIGLDPQSILVRVDSGHDASDFIEACDAHNLKYIIKRNFRRQSTDDIVVRAKSSVIPLISRDRCTLKYRIVDEKEKPANAPNSPAICIFEVRDPISDKNGFDKFRLMRVKDVNSPYFGRDGIPYEVHGWWTNLNFECVSKDIFAEGRTFSTRIINLYRDHATSEQYHSELKTDMNMELLPSHYFATNRAYLALSAISFSILRLIGDHCIELDPSLQHHKNIKTTRIRLRTVINEFFSFPFQLVKHAGKTFVKLGKNCKRFKTFLKICYIN